MDELNYVKNNRPFVPSPRGKVNSFTIEENMDYSDSYADYQPQPMDAKVLPDPNEYDFWDRPLLGIATLALFVRKFSNVLSVT